MWNGWWFPKAISSHAASFDEQFMRTLVAALAIFAAAQCALVLLAWRYRSRSSGAVAHGGEIPSRMEVVWTSATAILFLGLLLTGARTWAGVQFTAPDPRAEVIEVMAKQFAWNFRYAGKDGQFGRTDLKLVDDSAGNPFGLDEKDPSAKDDIASATLRLPAGREVTLSLNSRDVIHSFFVRELRIKQDVVPGMRIPLRVRADVPGTYEVPCSELCGLGHHQMRTMVIVMPPGDYDRWKQEQVQ